MSSLETTIKQLSALSQDTRMRAFKLLMEKGSQGIQAGEISKALDVAPNSLSAHLSILSNAGLIAVERQGRKMIYRPQINSVNAMICSLIEDCCHGHDEVQKTLAELNAR